MGTSSRSDRWSFKVLPSNEAGSHNVVRQNTGERVDYRPYRATVLVTKSTAAVFDPMADADRATVAARPVGNAS
ncbi:hypothetical protein CSW57_15995 [Williamsia muralis]|uniref:Uncharacterized protein n=1 Tax=Williamsia marianensis TaxID=85044 RepID=A0A2G3PHX2_WILMA|nr:hypothetical protein CSW57_15995 [Williamsia marianensis]PZT94211.1 MAG: hypothetical protein DI630_26175 [Gordonia sp. (in: high G+C Gram-positive bacteria)]